MDSYVGTSGLLVLLLVVCLTAVAGDADLHSNSYSVDGTQNQQQQDSYLNAPATNYITPGVADSGSHQQHQDYAAPPAADYAAPNTQYGAPPPAAEYGAPSSNYGAPPPKAEYGAPTSGYGAPTSHYGAPPAAEYGAPTHYGAPAPAAVVPHVHTVPSSQKFNFYHIAAAFKVMLLYLLFVLFKLTYLTNFPTTAHNRNFEELDIPEVSFRLVNQIITGEFDADKLFSG